MCTLKWRHYRQRYSEREQQRVVVGPGNGGSLFLVARWCPLTRRRCCGAVDAHVYSQYADEKLIIIN